MQAKNFTKTKEQSKEDAKIAIEKFMQRGGSYLSMRLKGNFRWPSKFTTLKIEDYEILLWPRTNWDQPGLIIRGRGDGKEEAKFAMRFLSGLTWESGQSFEHEGFWMHGNRINPCFLQEEAPHNPYAHEHFIDEHDYIPLPTEEKARIALALYREALSLNNDSYKFLSFAKILNIKFHGQAQQVKWMNDNLPSIGHQAKERLLKLQQTESDVGNYLYVSGRCAVAHAYADPVVNPDNPEDTRRLNADLPVIKALVELMIEQEFGIKSSQTVYREHLYELAGFKKILGTDLVSAILDPNEFAQHEKEIIAQVQGRLSPLSIRLRGIDARPFEALHTKVIGYKDGTIFLYCHSEDDLRSVGLAINLQEEHLLFDPFNGFDVRDNGSAEMAIMIADAVKFNWHLFGNGVLEVWKEEDLMGRLDAYIPMNVMPGKYEEVLKRCRYWEQQSINRTMMPQDGRLDISAQKQRLLSSSMLTVYNEDQTIQFGKNYNFISTQERSRKQPVKSEKQSDEMVISKKA